LSNAKVADALREIGIIATVRVPNEQQLLRGVAALTDGGIRAVELPYTTVRCNGWLIQQLKENGLLIGVGAVTRSAQAREAGVFGADFITASVITPDVVLACNEMDVPCILSGITPTEVWRAHEMAADFVKITAAEPLGGPHYIRSLLEMLPAVRLVGADMTLDGHASYLEAGVEVLEFKSTLAFPDLVGREAWAELTQQALEVVEVRNNWRVNQSSTKVRGARPLPVKKRG
jgi:2-dehydro-3-deoxyphosphogluconate aldolase/(4S)-4-hydroxy-2-oxoglutarate aldolase